MNKFEECVVRGLGIKNKDWQSSWPGFEIATLIF